MKFDRCGRICIDDFLFLTKRGELRNRFAGGIHSERIAIKHQLIVAADKVAVTDWTLMHARLRRDHFKAARRHPQPKWRRTQIENDLRPLLDQSAHWVDIVEWSGEILVRPDVLTNRDADFFSSEIKRRNAIGRFKVTVFVENIISRQKTFVIFTDRLASLHQNSPLPKRFSPTLL